MIRAVHAKSQREPFCADWCHKHLRVDPAQNSKQINFKEWRMRTSLVALGLMIGLFLLAMGRLGARTTMASVGEDDFRKLEQVWLDAASVPDLPTLRKMFSEEFMGPRSAAVCLARTM